MKISPKIDTDFLTVYSNQIDTKRCIDLIEKVSMDVYPLVDVARRPHMTMDLPIAYKKEDSLESIELKNIFLSILTKYMHHYIAKKNISKIELYKDWILVSKLLPGKPMEVHIDSKDPESIGFAVFLYINDDYEGGELYFKEHDFSYKPSSGDIAFFQLLEPHGVNSVLSNNRYSMGCAFAAPVF